jgi:hypothetical protein
MQKEDNNNNMARGPFIKILPFLKTLKGNAYYTTSRIILGNSAHFLSFRDGKFRLLEQVSSLFFFFFFLEERLNRIMFT